MAETLPGWYPDPSGKPMQRYFDGKEWTEHYAAAGLPAPPPPATPSPTSATPKKAPAMIGKYPAWSVVGVVVLVFMVVCIIVNNASEPDRKSTSTSSSSSTTYDPPPPPTYSPEEIQDSALSTCEDAVKKSLKDPDSAKFGDDWKAWKITAANSTPPAGMSYNPAAGDTYYNAGGSVNAKNGFGGYSGDQPYYCDVVVTTAGDVHAVAKSMADLLNPP